MGISDLIKKINPTKKLIYTFNKHPSNEVIDGLRNKFDFKLKKYV